MNLGEALGIFAAIVIGASAMFIFPMASIADRSDDVAEIEIQSIVEEFVNNASNTGKITTSDYDKLVADLNATGNTYDIEMELKVLDENPTKKNTGLMGDETKIGENTYYSRYTSQILDTLDRDGTLYMKKGDIITVKAYNNNNTLSQEYKRAMYGISGSNTYKIYGSATAGVTTTGSGK